MHSYSAECLSSAVVLPVPLIPVALVSTFTDGIDASSCAFTGSSVIIGVVPFGDFWICSVVGDFVGIWLLTMT